MKQPAVVLRGWIWAVGLVILSVAFAGCSEEGSSLLEPQDLLEEEICPLSVFPSSTCDPPDTSPPDTSSTDDPCPTCDGLYIENATLTSCKDGSRSDMDGDGWADACEFAIAYAFRPVMIFHGDEDWWGREPYWAFASAGWGGSDFKVMYMFAYYEDSQHLGDSEFAVVYGHNSANERWVLDRVFLSAHYNEPGGLDNSDWYDFDRLVYYDSKNRGQPLVYASKGKHANYNTRQACNSTRDSCGTRMDPNQPATAVLMERNVGQSYFHWVDCVNSSKRPGEECFWSGSSFKGWNITNSGVTAYSELLLDFGF